MTLPFVTPSVSPFCVSICVHPSFPTSNTSGTRIRTDPQGFKHVVDSAQLPSSTTLFFEVLPSTQPTATAVSFIEEVHEDTAVQDAYKVYQLALATSKDKNHQFKHLHLPPPLPWDRPRHCHQPATRKYRNSLTNQRLKIQL